MKDKIQINITPTQSDLAKIEGIENHLKVTERK